ncbi:hypothetical protein [Rubritalea tangerina]|uniref:Uncharacterized protein n=1 Tax=Rubritalea tangerina TaxID=430798 RepID=A0ABW4Z7F9_9BACT
MWVSKVKNSAITSSGTPASPHSSYTLSFFCALDTRHLDQSGRAKAEILLGKDISSASVIATHTFQAQGRVEGTSFNKENYQHQLSVHLKDLNHADKLFFRITNLHEKQWCAVDDITLKMTSPTSRSVSKQSTSKNTAALLSIGSISLQMQLP